MTLRKGTPVIINESDAPMARLVAVLTTYDAKRGQWRARYLSTYPHRQLCWTDGRPTPLAEFGVAIEICGDQFRCVANGKPNVAIYSDGISRRWQDGLPSAWRDMRDYPRKFLADDSLIAKGETV